MIRYASALLVILIITCFRPALAEVVKIKRVLHPDMTEVQEVETGEYHMVSNLLPLNYPVSARRDGNYELVFRHRSVLWRIERSGVELVGEKLVIDACSTVPAVLAADATSASVKGAGEGCK